MATHLTERVVKAAEIGTRKYVVFDEDCAGFGLCVFLSGRKGFILIYRAAGRQRRMTIGTWPSWSVVAAREEAKRLKRDIDRGEDPMDVRTNARHAPTVEELVERYIDEHLPKLSASSAKDQASMLRTLVLPDWRSRKVADITPTDVDRLLIKVAAGRPRVWKKPVKPIAVPRAFKSKRSAGHLDF
ncbi:integrase arm-type DNA-binding domain-containing protein [Paracoccaceae bacterium Fryx2]|nr:integrase arm-type DNA-binding domain-containing protein [Paracoccaceae bacterium Fryx2]